ncbi:MAG: MerR family transcriptional regulator [Peptococcaceae bacterium]|nr:MerR family transcriptional regulator [Peptococcaceae bacterium]
MKNLLSIGEVCQIKGFSRKALRYYERIGILPPAHVDPANGYRYYSPEQLAILDLITICQLLDIPLKRFADYQRADGSIDIQTLCDDGQRLVKEKIERLTASADFLTTMRDHISRTQRIKSRQDIWQEHFDARHLLIYPWAADPDNLTGESYAEISHLYTRLYQQCAELHIADTFDQGVVFCRRENRLESSVFLEIPRPIDAPNILTLPAGDYRCQVFEETALPTRLPDDFTHVLLCKDLFEPTFTPTNALIELQKY